MPVSGEVMFSDEWMLRNSKGKVPPMFARMCRDLCKDQNLGNDNSIEMVWLTLKPHIKRYAAIAYRDGVDEWDSEQWHTSGMVEPFKKTVMKYAEEFVDPLWLDNQGN